MEAAHTRLAPRGSPPAARAGGRGPVTTSVSSLHPSTTAVLEPGRPTVWRDLLLEYKRRKAAAQGPAPAGRVLRAAPFVPGARNWLPLGPSVVLNGQTVDDQPVAGRVVGLAVGRTGQIVYAASANGGVFRSDDGATTWRSLMDAFDLDPTNFASASLVCGAIAIDLDDPERVYVGTGEGDTLQLFRERVTGALPAYRGVGPIRSDDGGKTWVSESSAPDLAGEAFFSLAVDPGDRENVVAGTTIGLYRRMRASGGTAYQWSRVRNGVHSSVVVGSSGGTTRFYCAEWGQGATSSTVLYSDDGGSTWLSAGSGLPTADTGRIALGVQRDTPSRVYAFVTTAAGRLKGLYRLDAVPGSWKPVKAVPDVLPGKQGAYDLTISVDPGSADLVYLGGDRTDASPYPGSIWRCEIQGTAGGYRVKQAASIGSHSHADVHVLIHSPGDPAELWCGCDGGVFLNRDPRGTGEFVGQNNGLACLCSNFIGQHPTDPSVLFSGLQDNGTARTASGPIWSHVNWGDGGYCLVNWAKPDLVLVYANGTVYRSTNGGTSHDAWSTSWGFNWATMTQPIVGPPFNAARAADADLVAVGAGDTVVISDDFAASWSMQFTLPGGNAAGLVFALAFASPKRLFVGTTTGRVFQADRSGKTWNVVRLDDAAGGALGLEGLIADVAVDWADQSLGSLYVCFGGMGDPRRVWWYDGTKWEARSGQAGTTSLLDVEHNALVVDPASPNDLYVGADIGVWHSSDRGRTWAPLQNGLPDAPVFDLQIHPSQRLLRAATHGRGLFEITLD